MKESIEKVLEAGFLIENVHGGYIQKKDNGQYLHQTYIRSSLYFQFIEDAIDSFLKEDEG